MSPKWPNLALEITVLLLVVLTIVGGRLADPFASGSATSGSPLVLEKEHPTLRDAEGQPLKYELAFRRFTVVRRLVFPVLTGRCLSIVDISKDASDRGSVEAEMQWQADGRSEYIAMLRAAHAINDEEALRLQQRNIKDWQLIPGGIVLCFAAVMAGLSMVIRLVYGVKSDATRLQYPGAGAATCGDAQKLKKLAPATPSQLLCPLGGSVRGVHRSSEHPVPASAPPSTQRGVVA